MLIHNFVKFSQRVHGLKSGDTLRVFRSCTPSFKSNLIPEEEENQAYEITLQSVCLFIYIYIYVCVWVCVCVCEYECMHVLCVQAL
jgi:hypothetical protein